MTMEDMLDCIISGLASIGIGWGLILIFGG